MRLPIADRQSFTFFSRPILDIPSPHTFFPEALRMALDRLSRDISWDIVALMKKVIVHGRYIWSSLCLSANFPSFDTNTLEARLFITASTRVLYGQPLDTRLDR
ncbi:hypothetical protein KCV03_g340, partial [Aureobasidium melanogenum]